MQPYEIRQLRDGTIDYNNYIARPVSLLTPEMRRFCRQAASPKILLLAIAIAAVFIFAASQSMHRSTCSQCVPATAAAQVNS